MQSKLTLTVDTDVVKSAKTFAHKQGRSLSAIIENYLKLIIKDDAPEKPALKQIQKLKGALKLPADFDYKKELADAINEKHKK